MGIPLRVLIVEDSEDDTTLLVRELRRGSYDPTFERVDTPAAMKAALDKQTWDIVISDHNMPHFSSLAALTLLKENGLDLPFIIVSGNIGEDIAVAAMKAGAHDYIMKDNLARLNPALERELREAEVRRERKRAEVALRESEMRFRSVAESANDAIISADSRGIIIFWNKGAQTIFGYAEEEVLGQPVTLLMPEQYRDSCRRGLERPSSPGESHLIGKTAELQGLRKDGSKFPLELSLASWVTGEETFYSSIIRDITERKRAEEERAQLLIHEHRLKQYLSPQVVNSVILKEDIKLVNTRKFLTIVFTDLRGFTEFSDNAEPEDVIDLLNDYLSEMTAIIFKYEGTLDKIIGDGMLVFFGDPVPMQDHAQRAVKMAIEMREKIKLLQKKWPLEEYLLNIGIGINTGFVTVGNIGSENRMDYTVIGKQVNIASRLQLEAKSGEIIISKRTFEAVKEFVAAEEIQQITVKGLRNPVSAYKVIGWKKEQKSRS